MMSDQSFASEWNRLKAGETTDGIKRIIYPDHHLDLWIMFTKDMHRCLQIEIPNELEEPSLPSLAGFECRTDQYGAQRFITFELPDSRLNNVFDALLVNLIETSGAAPSEKAALEILMERLGLWTELLKKRAQKKNLSEVLGLLGELLIFERFVDIGLPLALTIDGWRGPNGDATDIGINDRRVEIKAKLVTQHLAVDITSADQLTSDERDLFLAINFFTRSQSGTSVHKTVERLLSKMADKPKATDLFNSKLMVAGYVEDADEFDELFELTRTRTYRVLDEFPRIQVPDLKPGIEQVKYKIDLNSIEAYECDNAELVATNEN